MRGQIKKADHILDAEIIDTWKNPDRVSLTRAELRDLQANKWGWTILSVCGAALCILIPLWLIGVALKPAPAVLPRCESNCQVNDYL